MCRSISLFVLLPVILALRVERHSLQLERDVLVVDRDVEQNIYYIMCDFAKRCPLEYSLEHGHQASLPGKKEEGFPSC